MLAHPEGPTLERIFDQLCDLEEVIALEGIGQGTNVGITFEPIGPEGLRQGLSEVVESAEETVESHTARANWYMAVENPGQAITHFQRAMELDDGSGSLDHSFYCSLGIAYVETSNYPHAISAFEMARERVKDAKVEPTYIESLRSIYTMRIAGVHCILWKDKIEPTKNRSKAIGLVGQVVQDLEKVTDPDGVDDILLEVASVWDCLGETQQAVAIYEKLTKRDPLELRYYVNMANSYELSGDQNGIARTLQYMEENIPHPSPAIEHTMGFIRTEYEKVCKTEQGPPEIEGIQPMWFAPKLLPS